MSSTHGVEKQGFPVAHEVKVPGYRRTSADGEKRGKIGRIELQARPPCFTSTHWYLMTPIG